MLYFGWPMLDLGITLQFCEYTKKASFRCGYPICLSTPWFQGLLLSLVPWLCDKPELPLHSVCPGYWRQQTCLPFHYVCPLGLILVCHSKMLDSSLCSLCYLIGGTWFFHKDSNSQDLESVRWYHSHLRSTVVEEFTVYTMEALCTSCTVSQQVHLRHSFRLWKCMSTLIASGIYIEVHPEIVPLLNIA